MGNISSAEEIKLGDKIGEGSYGEVFKAVWDGKRVAAKRIDVFESPADHSKHQGQRARFMADHDATGMPIIYFPDLFQTALFDGGLPNKTVPPLLLPAPVTL